MTLEKLGLTQAHCFNGECLRIGRYRVYFQFFLITYTVPVSPRQLKIGYAMPILAINQATSGLIFIIYFSFIHLPAPK